MICVDRNLTRRHEDHALLVAEKEAFARLAKGDGIAAALNVLLTTVERLAGEALTASVWLVDRGFRTISFCAGPRVPAAYRDAADGSALSPNTGSCGRAVYTGQPVIVPDVRSSELWAAYADLLVGLALRASWSTPIFSSLGTVLGTFAVYYSEPREPRPEDRRLVDRVAQTTAVLIERHRADEALQAREAALRASDERVRLLMATAELLLRSPSPQTAIDRVCRKVMDFLDCQVFFNFLLEPSVGRLRLNAYSGIPADEARRIAWLDLGVAVCGCVARDGSRIIAEHIGDAPDAQTELVRSYGVRAYACHPLIVEDRVIGTVSFGTATRRTFSDEDVTLMKAVADQIAIAVQRMQSVGALRQSEERLDIALRSCGAAIWDWDVAADVETVTPEYRALYGFAPDEVVTTDLWLDRVHPDDRGRLMQRVKTLLATEGEWNEEFRILHPERGERWLAGFGKVLRTDGSALHVVGVNFDITDRKKAVQRLHESDERLRTALAAGDMGAWDIDLATGAVTWDAKQYDLFGRPRHRPPADMEEFYALVHPDDVERVRRAARAAELTGRFSEEFRIVRPDGGVRWIAGHGAIVAGPQGRPARMVGVNYDITERKESQARLQHFAEELERRVAERTEELVASQAQLRALAAELNITEQRERKRLATELHDHLAQMLVLARLRLGQLKQVREPGPKADDLLKQAEEVLCECLAYTRTLVADLSPPVLHEFGLPAALRWLSEQMRRYHLSVAVKADDDPEMRIPEEQAVLLFQSVRELLMNAVKHAQCACARVTVERGDGALRILVQDDGAGFDPSAVRSGSANGGVSSKFGLFSIRERMRALGGSFDLASAPGRGTAATLVLPLHGETGAMFDVPGSKLTGDGGPAVSSNVERRTSNFERPQEPARIRVLLVDDHAMMRQGLRALLDGHAEIDLAGEAADGEEAVALAGTLRPAVVVMDINMPKKNGIDATAEMKALYPDVTVIGLSVNADDDNRTAMLKAGAMMLLTKEAAVEHLYGAIQQAVKRR